MTAVVVVLLVGMLAAILVSARNAGNGFRAQGNIPISPYHYATFYLGFAIGLLFAVIAVVLTNA